MADSWVIDLIQSSLQTMLLVAGPLLFVALAVGLVISIFQAITQINEATLTFIPKILAVAGALLVLGPWMLRILVSFTTELYENIDVYIR